MISSRDISSVNQATGRPRRRAACRAKSPTTTVLPIDGRAATVISWPGRSAGTMSRRSAYGGGIWLGGSGPSSVSTTG